MKAVQQVSKENATRTDIQQKPSPSHIQKPQGMAGLLLNLQQTHGNRCEQLRQEVAEGLLFCHSRESMNTSKILEVTAFAYALIELRMEKGLLTEEYLLSKGPMHFQFCTEH